MFILYDLIYLLFCLVYFPSLLIQQKWHPHFFMRLGFFPENLQGCLRQQQNIWVHAVSVGEVLAVKRFLELVKRKFPKYHIVISTVTTTGYRMAQVNFSQAGTVIYAPLDFSWVVRKFIGLIHPKLYITVETEIWPNLLMALAQEKIPMVQVNGRISDRSFGGYQLLGCLTRRVLKVVTLFCMQTPRDAQRIIALGAPKDKVRVIGNLKFDDGPMAGEFPLEELGLTAQEKIWIAGSTHPGEEAIVLEIYKKLQAEFRELRLMIAPRHPQRAPEVIKLAERKGFLVMRFSQRDQGQMIDNQVMVIDTMGHLKALYPLAHLVFVGKSLTAGGGHNIIEPACFGKPILVGPRTDNFKDIVRIFLEHKAIIQVKNQRELLFRIRELLKSPEQMRRLGQRAQEVVRTNRGAVEKTMDILSGFLTV